MRGKKALPLKKANIEAPPPVSVLIDRTPIAVL